MKAIGYVRVSTEEQARGGVSLAAQEEKVRAWAALMDADLVDVVVDAGYSGAKIDRPGLSEALERLRSGEAETLVVYAIDRLSRSTLDFLATVRDLAKAGVGFVSVRESLDSGSPHGKFTMTILAAVAEMERDLIASRTSEGMARCAAERRVYGSTPYGFARADGRLVEVPEEVAIIDVMRRRRLEGWSLRAIADYLNGCGVKSRTGRTWRHTAVKSVLETSEKLGVSNAY